MFKHEIAPQSPQSCERIFFLLLIVSWCCLAFAVFFLWKLTYLGLEQIHPILPGAIGIVLTVILLSIAFGIALFLKIIILKRKTFFFHPIRRLVIQYLFPLMILIGRLFRIPDERTQCSFIGINNDLVNIEGVTVTPERIIILLPQCLQNSDCLMRITRDIRVCKGCGRCQIAQIIPILDQYEMKCWVATGGTLARKYITDYRPDAIIAVACPRDLSSGIVDCFPIPVYGILNQRPEGPCVNTLVDLEAIRLAIQNFVVQRQDRYE